ncbi:MAG: hypothetical protein ABRQ37_18980 [Candidatus Eremiobacterota bacterium]
MKHISQAMQCRATIKDEIQGILQTLQIKNNRAGFNDRPCYFLFKFILLKINREKICQFHGQELSGNNYIIFTVYIVTGGYYSNSKKKSLKLFISDLRKILLPGAT